MDFNDENTEVINQFFERTFFARWGGDENVNSNFKRVEIILTPECNLACRYCYINKYGKDLYKECVREKEDILNNLDMLMDWLIRNDYQPELDLFSGDIFSQQIGYDALDIIYNKYKKLPKEKRIDRISVPCNFTFILDEDLTQKVKDYINKFKELEINLGLSASFDGKIIEDNRPMIPGDRLDEEFILQPDKKEPRDDEYYEELFQFAKEIGIGFHPMVYSRKIDKWKDNWLWFQKMFKKYNLPYNNIYLLEVRNIEWTDEQIIEFGEFLKFLVRWTFDILGEDKGKMVDFIFTEGYNILKSPFTKVGRGLGCSIQAMIYIRLGDLALVPCHRTMYEGNEIAHFKKKDGMITGIEADNLELGLGVYSFDSCSLPQCNTCIIEPMCSKGCLGSQLEETGDMFTPIPTVCQLEHYKIKSLIEVFEDIGIFNSVVGRTRDKVAEAIIKMREDL